MTALFFVYGLAFFVMGLTIAVYPKKQSKSRLGQNIWLIATFAILHALNEWVDMFITIQKPFEISSLQIIRSFLLPLSFVFLLQFGARTITEVKNRYPALKALPVILLIIWAIIVISSNQRFLMADIGARYLLAVPGTLLASYALMLQSAEIKKLGLSRPIAYLKLSALGFFFYGFFTGLIVPDASFFPATVLNYTVFAETTGSEVQVFRMLCALVITFGMTEVLGIFEWETIEALRKSRDEFEIKVKERTSDLIETNRDLEREITERRRAEEHIIESLREKETLLRELYHRTKNNMQVISSLIDLEALSVNDKNLVDLFKATQNRIKSMALVHEKLYQSKDLSNVNLKDYIDDLAHALLASYQIGAERIALKLCSDNISVSMDAATPCGLIVNELMSNSLKYSFPDERRGEISIVLHKTEEGEIELHLSDNGIGFPEGFDLTNAKSLGLKLVKNLAEKQLKGKIELRTNERMGFLIKFKEPQYLKRI